MSPLKIPAAVLAVVKKSTAAWSPDGRSRGWSMEGIGDEGDFLFRRRGWPSDIKIAREIDGGQYLSEFMAIRSPENALRFLEHFGSPAAEMNKWWRIQFSEIRELQELVGEVAQTPLSKWPSIDRLDGLYPEKIALRLESDRYTFVHETRMGIEACCAQVFFEKLSGVEFRWCARQDCNGMFRRETRHDKIYCSPECAHVVAVRKSRAAANQKRHGVRGRNARR